MTHRLYNPQSFVLVYNIKLLELFSSQVLNLEVSREHLLRHVSHEPKCVLSYWKVFISYENIYTKLFASMLVTNEFIKYFIGWMFVPPHTITWPNMALYAS